MHSLKTVFITGLFRWSHTNLFYGSSFLNTVYTRIHKCDFQQSAAYAIHNNQICTSLSTNYTVGIKRDDKKQQSCFTNTDRPLILNTSRQSFRLALLDLICQCRWYIFRVGRQIITGRHISDTHTMRWRIYYVHPQSGRTLFLDTLCQASGGCLAVCSGENSAVKYR